jgi:hypothetical protein
MSKFKDTAVIDIYKEYIPYSMVNRELMDKIKKFELDFINKKGTSKIADFLANTTIGEYEFIFSKNDSFIFFNDILGLNKEKYDELESRIKKVLPKAFIKTSRPDWGIYPYLMRALCANKKNIDHNKDKELYDDLNLVYRLLAYTTISYLNNHYFKYLKSHDDAVSAANLMSMKFKLRVCGSWLAFINFRFNYDFNKGTNRYNDIRSDETDSYLKIISDVHVRYRDQYKLSYKLYDELNSSNMIKTDTLNRIDIDGNENLKPIFNNVTTHCEYIKNNLINPMELIDPVLVSLVTNKTQCDKDVLVRSITILNKMEHSLLEKWVNVTISFIYNKLQENNQLVTDKKMILQLIKNVNSVLSANHNKDKALGFIRNTIEDYIIKIVTLTNKKILRQQYLGLCIYLFLVGIK